MKGNFHVRFLGEGVAARRPPYPAHRADAGRAHQRVGIRVFRAHAADIGQQPRPQHLLGSRRTTEFYAGADCLFFWDKIYSKLYIMPHEHSQHPGVALAPDGPNSNHGARQSLPVTPRPQRPLLQPPSVGRRPERHPVCPQRASWPPPGSHCWLSTVSRTSRGICPVSGAADAGRARGRLKKKTPRPTSSWPKTRKSTR